MRYMLVLLFVVGCAKPASQSQLLDFIDHPKNYEGKTLTLPLTVATPYLQSDHNGSFLAETGGGVVHEVYVTIPPKLNVPNAGQGDKVLVTFKSCGQLNNTGNVATKVVRR